MKLISESEALTLISSLGQKFDPKAHSSFGEVGYTNIQLRTPNASDLNFLAYQLAFSTRFPDWTLALITDYHIFSNFENTFLYQQLRKANGNYDHIKDTPGHLFLAHESYELFSLIEICILNSWDLAVFSQLNYTRFKTSHDGFIDVYSNDSELIAALGDFKKEHKL